MNRRALLAETLGTFIMIFAGCGAMVIDVVVPGSVTHVGVAITWGLIVMAMIYALGDISGAHMNPAVTLAFVCARRFEARLAPGYIAAQAVGAFAAVGVLRLMFGNVGSLGASLPHGEPMQSFVLEFVLTFILMLVVLCVSSGAKEKGIMAGIAIGGVVALEAMFAGPICGASMNPIRSLAPAVVSGNTQHVWVYLTAPVLGAMLAVPMAKGMRQETKAE